MVKIGTLKEAGVGLADKSVGLVLEAAGTFSGSRRLKEAGRARQEAGTERLLAVEEDVKALSRAGEAKAGETRQKGFQSPEARSAGKDLDDQTSAASATAEKIKGVAKKGLASVTGNDRLKGEAEAQTDKADAQAQAAKHEAKAEAHRKKADLASKGSDAMR